MDPSYCDRVMLPPRPRAAIPPLAAELRELLVSVQEVNITATTYCWRSFPFFFLDQDYMDGTYLSDHAGMCVLQPKAGPFLNPCGNHSGCR